MHAAAAAQSREGLGEQYVAGSRWEPAQQTWIEHTMNTYTTLMTRNPFFRCHGPFLSTSKEGVEESSVWGAAPKEGVKVVTEEARTLDVTQECSGCNNDDSKPLLLAAKTERRG